MERRVFILLFFGLSFTAFEIKACQSSIGGTCSGGTAFRGDLRGVNRIETCQDDIYRDWCVVVYKEIYDQADFHCFNSYNTNPFYGTRVCGNGPFDINDGGCARLRAPDGSACLVCCCRGQMCNNQYVFAKELSQYFVFTNHSPSPPFLPIISFIALYFFQTLVHILQ